MQQHGWTKPEQFPCLSSATSSSACFALCRFQKLIAKPGISVHTPNVVVSAHVPASQIDVHHFCQSPQPFLDLGGHFNARASSPTDMALLKFGIAALRPFLHLCRYQLRGWSEVAAGRTALSPVAGLLTVPHRVSLLRGSCPLQENRLPPGTCSPSVACFGIVHPNRAAVPQLEVVGPPLASIESCGPLHPRCLSQRPLATMAASRERTRCRATSGLTSGLTSARGTCNPQYCTSSINSRWMCRDFSDREFRKLLLVAPSVSRLHSPSCRLETQTKNIETRK